MWPIKGKMDSVLQIQATICVRELINRTMQSTTAYEQSTRYRYVLQNHQISIRNVYSSS
jgi:hypothetical protein